MTRRKSPQDKKRESYLHDRRNTYGESDKASRKSIPLRKRKVRRADRRVVVTDLTTLAKSIDPAAEDLEELELQPRRGKLWRKSPDDPLGEVLKTRLQRRVERGAIEIDLAEKRIAKIDQHMKRQQDDLER